MKLFTNTGNSASLKILISSSFAKVDIPIEVISASEAGFQNPKRLPILQIDDVSIFSSNAAAQYLYSPSDGHLSAVQRWLDWEAVLLQPVLVKSSKLENCPNVSEHLSKLNSTLGKQQYLIKDVLTVSDIVVWSTLFPIFTDEQLEPIFSAKYESIGNWFKHLANLPEFKSAVEKFSHPGGIACIQNVGAAGYFPAVNTTTTATPASDPCKKAKPSKPRKDLLPSESSESSEALPKEPPITDVELQAAHNAWKSGPTIKPKPSVTPVLPIAGERNVLITSALPYVNNVPHLGNIIGCVLSADVFARYSRLKNWNTLFVCGTDEYGTATETKAIEEGLTPEQICNKYFEIHKEIYSWFNISFDKFGRTTTKQQTEVVHEMFRKVHSNGFTSVSAMEQLLCEKCDKYLADRFVEGTCPKCSYEDARGDQCDGCGNLINAVELIKPRCKLCQTRPVVRLSDQLFLELPKVEKRVAEWLESASDGWSNNAKVISKAWLKDGLKPRCITRDLKWGIPVPLPGFEKKVFYVWFDAPIGYMSITKTYTEKWRSWWEKDKSGNVKVTLYQFMAKDNVPFHSIMFPSTLFAAGGNFNLVSHLMATEYLNYEDGKFSKSRGVGVFGTDAKETGIPSDIFRFYLLYVRPEGQDSSFSWADLVTKNNSELLNNLGNFINRALVFVEKFFDYLIPEMNLTEDDYTYVVYINRLLSEYSAALENGSFRFGLRHILGISRYGNLYFQTNQPWALMKGSAEDKKRAGSVIGLSCNIACLLAILLKPYMPQTCDVIAKQLNAPDSVFVLPSHLALLLSPGHKIGKPAPLFTKIEPSTVEELKKRFGGKQQPATNGPASNNKKKPTTATLSSHTASIKAMEDAVAKQGNLVREMKASGVPKTEWQPQVTVLLDMKKQLAELQKHASVDNVTGNGDVEGLRKKVAEQGDLVRKVKSSGVPKSEWQPHVDVLLSLKKQLAEAEKQSQSTNSITDSSVVGPAESVKDLEEKITKQGDLVRKMKGSGASRSEWQPQVNILLDLKKQLAAAQKTC
ncbi:hypothetical protein LSTR_LSTR006215 [Laodelphax striatellus]|uniref:Methionine--tRNA ligase, cytoplasmic n=1 Tax=Laodelphax striatellus TaxID=195883 RepID=A0A482XS09_LAOST|nr:hypothetical protein LSTR_LSTR006215 [Laodelphax striatellus]